MDNPITPQAHIEPPHPEQQKSHETEMATPSALRSHVRIAFAAWISSVLHFRHAVTIPSIAITPFAGEPMYMLLNVDDVPNGAQARAGAQQHRVAWRRSVRVAHMISRWLRRLERGEGDGGGGIEGDGLHGDCVCVSVFMIDVNGNPHEWHRLFIRYHEQEAVTDKKAGTSAAAKTDVGTECNTMKSKRDVSVKDLDKALLALNRSLVYSISSSEPLRPRHMQLWDMDVRAVDRKTLDMTREHDSDSEGGTMKGIGCGNDGVERMSEEGWMVEFEMAKVHFGNIEVWAGMWKRNDGAAKRN